MAPTGRKAVKGGNASAFAKLREEIQLWPAAVMALAVTEQDSTLYLGAFFVLVFTGAVTYRLHEAVRKAMTRSSRSREQQVRQRNMRDGVYDPNEGFLSNALAFAEAVKPDSWAARVLAFVAVLGNLFAGLALFGWLMRRVLEPVAPSAVVMGLFALPVVMVAAFTASVLWNL